MAGTVIWAVTSTVWPSNSHYNSRTEIIGGLAFQLGVAAYLALVGRMRAAGDRWGPRILAVEGALLALAVFWSVGTAINPAHHQSPALAATDVAWPLSMLGLVVVAIAALRSGMLQGAGRFAPLAASLWLLADGIGVALGIGRVVHVSWLIVTYGWLALVLFTLPDRARNRPVAISH